MKKIFFTLIILFSSCIAEAKLYVAEPLLVNQPSYAGMRFYVYKPYNMPKGWYVTFDGYPVKKNKDNVWVYGTSEGPNLVATNYIVGSVIPSMAGITRWVNDAQISALRKVPNQELMSVRQPGIPLNQLAAGQTHSTYIPDWTFNPRFMAIGNWKGSVDRIGILHTPVVPVAWKGDSPKVIYAWLGENWYQINMKDSVSPARMLKREMLSLTRLVRKSNFKWYEQDTPILSQQAKSWGYYWLGEIMPR